jgi:hypothetical protein
MFHSLRLTHQCAKYLSSSEVNYGSIGRRFCFMRLNSFAIRHAGGVPLNVYSLSWKGQF